MARLDAELVQRGICETRNRAQASIAEGNVTVNGAVCMKASQKVADTDILVLTEPLPFVGRGGYKLRYALAEFGILLSGRRCLDIGASTGGFTDCMLQNGAQDQSWLLMSAGISWRNRSALIRVSLSVRRPICGSSRRIPRDCLHSLQPAMCHSSH